jgi:hypothetical protein
MLFPGETTVLQTLPVPLFGRAVSRRVSLGTLLGIAVIASASVAAAFAQDTPKPAPQTVPSTPSDTSSSSSKIPPIKLFNLLQAKSIVFPDIAASTQPLSTGQKFQLFVDNSISVHTISWSVLGSAVAQADDSPTGFGQGWDAYAKRFGSSMARSASTEFFGTFLIASALHEDPRFYAEIDPPFTHAVKYSLKQVFIMRSDDGRDVVAWSRLAGPLMAEGLANVYWPDRNRSVGDTFFRFGLDLASRAGGNMLREYWPVFYGKITHAPRPAAAHD